ncbi:MAG TPA: Chromate resistance protein ChrB [Solirubrobacterales bacterium]|nr:Chromate resistance protein ChrB [Solirubrobacterales bacterium]
MADPDNWLLLIYRIPSEPSRLRAGVWRKLKALGAIYLQNSAAALPAGPGAERALRSLRREIQEMGGSAYLLAAGAVVGAADLTVAYNAARDEEYEEIEDRCRDFHAEIDEETAAEHFTYAELEENDEDLAKLRGWLDKVEARDVLGAGGRSSARKAIAGCEQALAGFAEQVYAAEEAVDGGDV